MSSLTKCNYCTLQFMKRQAKVRGVEVVLERVDGWTTARYSDRKEPSSFFLVLTDYCAC